MADYELYQPDGNTPIAIKRPRNATWEKIELSPFANGSDRTSKYTTVVWDFSRMSEAQYIVFTANRPPSGKMNFKTFRQATLTTPAGYYKCSGIMSIIRAGRKAAGEYVGVRIVWKRVTVL